MNPNRLLIALFWAPRILAILIALFVSILALDATSEGPDWTAKLAAFAIHLLPTGVILLFLLIAWRFDVLGGLLFMLSGVVYSVQAWGHPDWILLLSVPLFLTGFLFLLRPFVLLRAMRKSS